MSSKIKNILTRGKEIVCERENDREKNKRDKERGRVSDPVFKL